MENLRIYLPLVDDGQQPIDYPNGKALIEGMIGDDWGAPPKSLIFEATTDDGRTVSIIIPYKPVSRVSVVIE
jgi:hypothetical protein